MVGGGEAKSLRGQYGVQPVREERSSHRAHPLRMFVRKQTDFLLNYEPTDELFIDDDEPFNTVSIFHAK